MMMSGGSVTAQLKRMSLAQLLRMFDDAINRKWSSTIP